ncbi:MAG TPA: hypothetical protein DCM64_10220 [Gammaproteobacteria bacterium]|nr:hypothetical protein [Gammaproteobacteria bacterium]
MPRVQGRFLLLQNLHFRLPWRSDAQERRPSGALKLHSIGQSKGLVIRLWINFELSAHKP